jgi:hypothetical protein
MSPSDIAMLERAAKAAGYIEFTCRDGIGPRARLPNGVAGPWNPLDDDGDAMRLALAIAERLSRTGRVLCLSIGMGRSGCEFNFIDGPDQGANTRRAIVVAAATMAPKEPR